MEGHHATELPQGAAVRPTPSNILVSELPELAGGTVLFRTVKITISQCQAVKRIAGDSG